MVDTAALLAAYDAQMRMPSGTVPSGVTYEYDGPLLRIVGAHVGRIRAPRDVGVTGASLDRLIARQRDYFQARGQGLEWKLRAHDVPAELPERLVAAGFVPEKPSTVLLGFAEEAASEPVLPDGVVLRRVSEAEDLRRVADQQTEVWGFDCSWVTADLYRAMIASRAGEAVARGFRLLHVDASPASAPILRRLGFHEITTSTHYHWTPPR